MIQIFLADGLRRVGDGGGVDSEQIEVHIVPLASFGEWIANQEARGALVDPKVYAGLHLAAERPVQARR